MVEDQKTMFGFKVMEHYQLWSEVQEREPTLTKSTVTFQHPLKRYHLPLLVGTRSMGQMVFEPMRIL